MSVNKEARIGDLIQLLSNPNKQNLDYPFYGINKEKQFMPTVANTEGLDASKYTILKKGMFVFSGMQTGRDVCIRIGLYENESPVLISPAYTTFIIKDEELTLPEYFFLFFKRFEMDRYGWFLSDSSIRSNLDWDRFCDIQIPLPSIEVQRELVSVYSGLKSLAEANESLLQPLSDACQAFIVDCKKKYPAVKLGGYVKIDEEKNSQDAKYEFLGVNKDKSFMPTNANTEGLDRKKYLVMSKGKFVFSGMQTGRDVCIRVALYNNETPALVSPAYTTFVVRDENVLMPEYLMMQFRRVEVDRLGWFKSDSSIRSNLDWERFCEFEIPLPPLSVQQKVVDLYTCYEEAKSIAENAREQLKTICPALVQKSAHTV